MKTVKLFIVLLSVCFSVRAQEFKADVSYRYMYANQWDKIIQTYNFSRPFLTEKQPLLAHGLNASLSYLFKSDKNLKHGINLAYSYCRSYSENTNFENALDLHFVIIGYVLHYQNTEKLKGFYTDIIISATGSGLFRNVNGESFKRDDTNLKALSIGGDIALKLGYSLKLKERASMSPFVSVGYTPYMYSPNTESIVNQTKGLAARNWTAILSTQIGLAFHFRKS